MIDQVPEIWAYLPSGARNSIECDLQEACERRDWKYLRHKTVPVSMRDHRDRDVRTHVLNPEQATQLYVRLHRRFVGVMQLKKTHVPITPNPKGNLKDFLLLRQFTKYKSFFHTIGPSGLRAEQAEEVLSAMGNWIAAINDSAGESDPRCLPLHVFSAHRIRNLDAPDDRQQFNKEHGRQQSRYDKNGFHWERAHDMHGREVLYVAGRPLIKGFHWDVGLRTRGAKKVANTVAIWKVPSHGHVNIYPDAHIRKGHKSIKIYSG